MITADRAGNRITVSFPYDKADVEAIKTVPGHRWNKTSKAWTIPLTPEHCTDLRIVFGNRLRVTNGLADWYREERARREDIERMRAGQRADLPLVRRDFPLLWEALSNRPFQIDGAAMIVKARQFCLGDEPRLGKTYQAIAALAETQSQTILIACPKTACTTVWWRKMIELIGLEPYVAQEDRSNRNEVIAAFAKAVGPKALIVNKEMIRVVRYYRCDVTNECTSWVRVPGERSMLPQMLDGKGGYIVGWPESRIKPGKKGGCDSPHDHKTVYRPQFAGLFGITWDAIVLDECHHALASTKNIQSDAISQIRTGAMKLRTTENPVKIAMSGTPFYSKAPKSWGVLNWLRPDVFSSFWRYAGEHFDVRSDGWGQVVGDKPLDPEGWIEALRPYYLARTMQDVAPDIPEMTVVEVPLEMSDKQRAAYKQMAEMATAAIENGTLNATGILAERTRLKQFSCAWGRFSGGAFHPAAPSNKLDWILQFLKEREDTEGKVVIASQFTKIVNMFADQIRKAGWECLTLTGESTGPQRIHAQDEFLKGRTRVIVINLFAGGEAIDLSSADEMILIDEPDGQSHAVTQGISRIKNLMKSGVPLTLWKLLSLDTIEWHIANLNDEDRATLESGKPQALDQFKEML